VVFSGTLISYFTEGLGGEKKKGKTRMGLRVLMTAPPIPIFLEVWGWSISAVGGKRGPHISENLVGKTDQH